MLAATWLVASRFAVIVMRSILEQIISFDGGQAL
jgi:hypothetical protein